MRVIDLVELERQGEITLGRGKVISAKTLAQFPGEYPVYSSSTKGEGVFGRYGQYDFDEELLTWSVDGGGDLFHRRKHCFSITNVAGFLRINAKANIEYRFLYYLLRFKHARANFDWTYKAHPSVLRRVYKDLPIPSIQEQKRIAGILDEADRVQKKTQALIDKYDELAQSLFLDMFGDPVTNPKGWEKFELNVLGRITTGKTPPTSKEGMFGGDIPFITPGDLKTNEVAKRSLTHNGAIESRTVGKGSLLVCCIGATLGKHDIAKEICAFNQQINAVEWGSQIMPIFGAHQFNFLEGYLTSLSSSTTLPLLNKSAFQRVKIIRPPITLQETFAERIDELERLRQLSLSATNPGNKLFDSLLQKAFKGELT